VRGSEWLTACTYSLLMRQPELTVSSRVLMRKWGTVHIETPGSLLFSLRLR
jgi:hypothetical protein